MPRADQRVTVDRSSLSHNLPESSIVIFKISGEAINTFSTSMRLLFCEKVKTKSMISWGDVSCSINQEVTLWARGDISCNRDILMSLISLKCFDWGTSPSSERHHGYWLLFSVNGPDMDSFALMTNFKNWLAFICFRRNTVSDTSLDFTVQVYGSNINCFLKWIFALMEITFASHILASGRSAVSMLLISRDGLSLTGPIARWVNCAGYYYSFNKQSLCTVILTGGGL